MAKRELLIFFNIEFKSVPFVKLSFIENAVSLKGEYDFEE